MIDLNYFKLYIKKYINTYDYCEIDELNNLVTFYDVLLNDITDKVPHYIEKVIIKKEENKMYIYQETCKKIYVINLI